MEGLFPAGLLHATGVPRRAGQVFARISRAFGRVELAENAPAAVEPLVPDNGLIVVGSRATTLGESHAGRPSRLAGDAKTFDAAIKAGDRLCGYNHYREFVEAIQANDPSRCGSRLSYAAPLTEALLIGCIALRYPGEELRFAQKAMKFTNKPEANAFLKAPRRGDWDFAKLMAKRGL